MMYIVDNWLHLSFQIGCISISNTLSECAFHREADQWAPEQRIQVYDAVPQTPALAWM